MKPKHRAGVYILFAALSNMVTYLEDCDKNGHTPDERVQKIANELAQKLRIWYANKQLVIDYERDVTAVLKGLTGYETTQPLVLSMSLISHYAEYVKQPVILSKQLFDYLVDAESEAYDEYRNKLIVKSGEAGDAARSRRSSTPGA
jgi:hypothetical protein